MNDNGEKLSSSKFRDSLLQLSLIAMNAVRKSVLRNIRVDGELMNLIRLGEKNPSPGL
jgi:hypothetical protein